MIVGICASGWYRIRKMKSVVNRALPMADISIYRNLKSVMEDAAKKTCDVMLFEIRDGTELFAIRYLREHKPDMKILVYSEDGKYALDLINLGVSGYITEPITCEKVKEQMEHLRYA